MKRTSLLGLSALALALGALAACTAEDRIYGSGSGSGSGSGGGATTGSMVGSGGDATGTGGAGGNMPLTIAEACPKYAAVICMEHDQCIPFAEAASYGDNATCQARWNLFCEAVLGAPDTAWTPDSLLGCVNIQQAKGCQSFVDSLFGAGPAECAPPAGSRPVGSVCLDAGQCGTAYCKKTGGTCGTCEFREGVGGACLSPFDCKDGHTCLNGTCATAYALGEACVEGQIPCRFGLVCTAGVCRTPLALGEPCDVGMNQCDFFTGLFCDAQTLVCKSKLIAAEGEPCGVQSGDIYDCPASGICNMKTPPLCIPSALDGDPCAPGQGGPGCMPPSICYKGTCSVTSPGQCG